MLASMCVVWVVGLQSYTTSLFFHYLSAPRTQARVAMADVVELLEGAEAKAYYGLAVNWKPLQVCVCVCVCVLLLLLLLLLRHVYLVCVCVSWGG